MFKRIHWQSPRCLTSSILEVMAVLRRQFEFVEDEMSVLADHRILLVEFVSGLSSADLIVRAKSLRSCFPNNRIILIGPGLSLLAKFKIYEQGIDLYLPFYADDMELIKQISILMEKEDVVKSPNLNMADLVFDPMARIATRSGVNLSLRRKEAELLLYLWKHKYQPVSAQELLEQVWGYNYLAVTNTVQVHVSSLRKKLDRGFKRKLVHTLPKQGYMLSDRVTC